MHEPLSRYDVTVTLTKGGGSLPGPARFAAAAGQAASGKNASVMSAHTAEKIISVVTVEATGQSAAVAVALAVVSGPQLPGVVVHPLSRPSWPTWWGGS